MNNGEKSVAEVNISALTEIVSDATLNAKTRLRASELLTVWMEIAEGQKWTG